MTLSNDLAQNSFNKAKNSQIKALLDPEIIRALTPLMIALIGGAIGITVLIKGSSEAGFGVASTALAGAAGLAQPGKETSGSSSRPEGTSIDKSTL
ncbi:MAG: hypothetical protein Kow00121_47980 [Elainellaceae cyanobacterium]